MTEEGWEIGKAPHLMEKCFNKTETNDNNNSNNKIHFNRPAGKYTNHNKIHQKSENKNIDSYYLLIRMIEFTQ